MTEAALELLAPREDVWAFLAEPYHLADWWPGIAGVDPDVRGFAPGARWKVHASKRNVFAGRRKVETLLLIREIDLYERWSWHLLEPKTDTEIRLRVVEADRTLVTVATSTAVAKAAVKRLYDLVQTAATL
ncbi:MAG TPA: SRPBCC family protein [Gaiellaceae bacterium]|nr:SRPBCC family protein [Gaiellaceae bacterium]